MKKIVAHRRSYMQENPFLQQVNFAGQAKSYIVRETDLNRLDSVQISALIGVIANNTALRLLTLETRLFDSNTEQDYCSLFSNEHVKALVLKGDGIHTIPYLCEILRTPDCRLTKLILEPGNNGTLESSYYQSLKNALDTNQSLQTLSISGINMEDASLYELSGPIAKHPRLINLDLSYNLTTNITISNFLCALYQTNRTLENLILSGTGIDDININDLQILLQQCLSLRTLDLRIADLSPAGILHILSFFPHSLLTTLYLPDPMDPQETAIEIQKTPRNLDYLFDATQPGFEDAEQRYHQSNENSFASLDLSTYDLTAPEIEHFMTYFAKGNLTEIRLPGIHLKRIQKD